MKISCAQTDLLKGLQISQRAVPLKTTMSILECILIDASGNDIRLTANDMELGIETIIPGSIIEHGRVCLDAKIFVDMVRNLSNNQVTLYSDENNFTSIDCEKAHFEVPGKSGDEFPYLPIIPRNDPIRISQYSLRDIIQKTIFSVADNDTKPVLKGELMEISGKNMRLSSLDGHRISIRNLTLKDEYEDCSVILPGKTLNEVAHIVGGSMDDMVLIYLAENQVLFEFERTTVVSRLIEGKFFDINRMLSDDYETKITINRRDLMESIGRSVLMVNEADRKPIVLDIHDQVFGMTISSFKGNFNEELVMVKEGRDIKIAFNPKFILDALKAIDDETITMYLLSPRAPLFIRNEAKDYIYIILPVNFNS